MPVVFGEVGFQTLYDEHANKKLFDRQLDTIASRTIEDYVRSSKWQLYDTKASLGCQDGYGFLVILNEGFEFYKTGFVYRTIQSMLKAILANQKDLKIDGVWYINESAKSKGEVDVVFIHESNELDDVTPNRILNDLARGWAAFRGY